MTSPLLEVSRVSVHFGGVQALADVDLALPDGSVFGIAGPNGSGKTTLLNVISGVQRPARGHLRFDGVEYTNQASHRMPALGVARTFQNVRLVPSLSIAENVMVGLHHLTPEAGIWQTWALLPKARRSERRTRHRAHELLAELGIDHFAEQRPQELPYGFQRRVEIARALASEPRLLLLDEPTAGMTPPDVQIITDLLRKVAASRRMSMIVVEHNVPFLGELCSELAIMLAGRVLTQGTPAEVLADPRVVAAYLGKAEQDRSNRLARAT